MIATRPIGNRQSKIGNSLVSFTKVEEQRQCKGNTDEDSAQDVRPKSFHSSPASFNEHEQPQRQCGDENVHRKESGRIVLKKLMKEERDI